MTFITLSKKYMSTFYEHICPSRAFSTYTSVEFVDIIPTNFARFVSCLFITQTINQLIFQSVCLVIHGFESLYICHTIKRAR